MKSLTTTKLQTWVDYTNEEFNNYKELQTWVDYTNEEFNNFTNLSRLHKWRVKNYKVTNLRIANKSVIWNSTKF